MDEPIDALILDLLEFVSARPRPYGEVMEAWRTSCPRLPVWEEVVDRRFVERVAAGGEERIALTRIGRAHLEHHRPA